MGILQRWKERRRLARMHRLLRGLASGKWDAGRATAQELEGLVQPDDAWLVPLLLRTTDSCWHCRGIILRLKDAAFGACTEAVQNTEEPAHGNALCLLRLWGEKAVPLLARDLAERKSFFGVDSVQDIQEGLAAGLACSRLGVQELRDRSDVSLEDKDEAVKRVMVQIAHALEGDPSAVEKVFGIMFSKNPAFGIQWYPWLLDDDFLASVSLQMRPHMMEMKGRLRKIYEARERCNAAGLEAMGRGLTLGAD